MMLNVEELSLLSAFNTETRIGTIRDLHIMPVHLEDPDFEEVCRRLVKKLEKMSDEDYAALDLTIEEEDAYGK